MIGDKLQKAFNAQINAEFYSSYLYLAMSAYFATVNLPGFAHWMRGQAQEELAHGMKFFDFVNGYCGFLIVSYRQLDRIADIVCFIGL